MSKIQDQNLDVEEVLTILNKLNKNPQQDKRNYVLATLNDDDDLEVLEKDTSKTNLKYKYPQFYNLHINIMINNNK